MCEGIKLSGWNCTWNERIANERIAPIPPQSVAARLASLALIRLDAGERRPRRSGGGQPRRLTGRDKWAGFNIYVVRSSNCLTRPRTVELQAVIIEQTLPRRTAAKVQRPNSAWQRICETGTNAAIQGTPRRNRQQDVSELICARAGRQQWQDIANRLLDQKIGCRIEKRSGKKWLIEGVILMIVRQSQLMSLPF